jgi:hypothetical protein
MLNMLTAVSCPSASNCVAVGSQQTSAGVSTALAEHWNGSSWAPQSTAEPSGAEAANFQGISCPVGTTDRTAVGDWYASSPSEARTLGEQRAS